jgi:hypothetical protein
MNPAQVLKSAGGRGGSIMHNVFNIPSTGVDGIYWGLRIPHVGRYDTGLIWDDSKNSRMFYGDKLSGINAPILDAEEIKLKGLSFPACKGDDGQILILKDRNHLEWINGRSSRPGLARVTQDYNISEKTPSIVLFEGMNTGYIHLPEFIEPYKIFRVMCSGKNGVILRSRSQITARNTIDDRIYISKELMINAHGFAEIWADESYNWHINYCAGIEYTP